MHRVERNTCEPYQSIDDVGDLQMRVICIWNCSYREKCDCSFISQKHVIVANIIDGEIRTNLNNFRANF
jgi:G:T-mismatch repair DNA endonuclease (very short patch repair protein)